MKKIIFTLATLAIVLSACASKKEPILKYVRADFSKMSCKRIGVELYNQYAIGSAIEQGLEQAWRQSAKRLKTLTPEQRKMVRKKLERSRLIPHVQNFKKVVKQYKKRCPWPSKALQDAKKLYHVKALSEY